VTFDVAVSAEASDSTKSGAEVEVASSAERQTDLTRVQFCVPLLLPAGDRPKAKSERSLKLVVRHIEPCHCGLCR
jgi:hypothetical protein